MKQLLNGLFVLGAGVPGVLAAEPPDKSSYHLFNPVPREMMRELSTDRPDKTESAYTVDAGHFQLEADLVNYSYDAHNTARDHTISESLGIASFNFKVGLLNNWDVQFVVPTYNVARVRDRRAGARDTERGFGDFILRSKVNVWGNDGGATISSTVTLVVNNAAPVAGTDTLSTPQDVALNTPVGDLLANDTDSNGDTVSILAVSGLYPASFVSDFNSGLPAGSVVFGSATAEASGGVGGSEHALLFARDRDVLFRHQPG